MTEHPITIPFQARYYKSSNIDANTTQIWFVLHGYGQLAQYFIRKFNVLEQKNICVIAPEGLSRFYLEELQTSGRKNNRVGATWMTKENRLTDISNYLTFLDAIFEQEVGSAKIPVTIFGFSQGSATASRWILSKKIHFDRLILWAGVFPPDLDFTLGSEVLNGKRVQLVYGTKDKFLNESRIDEMNELIGKVNVPVAKISFDGGHDLHETTLLQISE
jgi:predicted esterase